MGVPTLSHIYRKSWLHRSQLRPAGAVNFVVPVMAWSFLAWEVSNWQPQTTEKIIKKSLSEIYQMHPNAAKS